jgi:D-glycero-D-manno-heptose 1,7-bisphosphate phosphatase
LNSIKRSALFLDRDGVINVDYGYVFKPEDFHFIDGIFELVAAANRLHYLVVVITNQAGIGRGYYTESDFHNLTDWMLSQFAIRGARIDAVYFCPHHPEATIEKYRQESQMRKPAPGMLFKAANDLNIDFKTSIIVGDKDSDMQAGLAADVQVLLQFNKEKRIGKRIDHLRDILAYLDSAAI